ncbi:MAG: ABC transporter permease [Candidatus Thermoplasmatota archaeon]|nr:ABC transporter permease [Candidatus Thermoplasmatota archaeon]MDA8142352.1 ABC transporter permease [Thermoplasmatales archaeon]
MKNQIRSISSLNAINGLYPLLRRPFALVAILSTPFSFLFFIYLFGGPSKILIASLGGLLFTIVNAATMLQTDLLFYKLDLKFQQMIAASPISPMTYTIGLATGNILFTLPGLVIFMAIVIYVSHIGVLQILALSATLLVTWIIFSMFSFLVSTRVREMRDIWPISVMFSIIFGVIPPIYYPISILPQEVQYVAYMVPTTWAALILKGIIYTGFSSIVFPSVVFVLEMIGVLAFTYRFSDWKNNRT